MTEKTVRATIGYEADLGDEAQPAKQGRPRMLRHAKAALIATLARPRLDSLGELVGADAAAVTSEPWPV